MRACVSPGGLRKSSPIGPSGRPPVLPFVSTRTWGGCELRRCPVCLGAAWVEPSTAGDAPCPRCGVLLWPGDRFVRSVVRGGLTGRGSRPKAGRRPSAMTARPTARLRDALRRAAGLARSAFRAATAPRPSPTVHSGVYDRWLDG